VTLAIESERVPVLAGVLDLARQRMVNRGDKTNREYVGDSVELASGISKEMASVLYDPQTAGGILMAIASDRADAMLALLRETYPDAAIIGRVNEYHRRSVLVT
jgi:selenide,water dikinase